MLVLLLILFILLLVIFGTLYFLGVIPNTIPFKKRDLREKDKKEKEKKEKEEKETKEKEKKEKEKKEKEEKETKEKEAKEKEAKEKEAKEKEAKEESFENIKEVDEIIYPFDKYPLLSDSCQRGKSNSFGVNGISAQTYSSVNFDTIKNDFSNCVQPDMIKL
jgi:FtsZ-interacting cell division protein ZipA